MTHTHRDRVAIPTNRATILKPATFISEDSAGRTATYEAADTGAQYQYRLQLADAATKLRMAQQSLSALAESAAVGDHLARLIDTQDQIINDINILGLESVQREIAARVGHNSADRPPSALGGRY